MSYAAPSHPRHRARRQARGLLLMPMILVILTIAVGVGYVGYVLWPRWPGPVIAPDAPPLPIIVGGTAFNVPQGAFRVPIQRRPGVQDRVDLVFMWPSLAPPAPLAKPAAPAVPGERPPAATDRIFITLAPAGTLLSPLDRLQSIYPRYLEENTTTTGNGLVTQSFLPGTPYQSEDLVYPSQARERFFLRCSRPGQAATPGICLHEKLIGATDVTFRFPREWLDDWQNVEAGIDRLLASLHPLAN